MASIRIEFFSQSGLVGITTLPATNVPTPIEYQPIVSDGVTRIDVYADTDPVCINIGNSSDLFDRTNIALPYKVLSLNPSPGVRIGAILASSLRLESMFLRGTYNQFGSSDSMIAIPSLSIVSDGTRCVMKVDGWTMMDPDMLPTNIYIGPAGLTTDILSATDIKGAPTIVGMADQALTLDPATGDVYQTTESKDGDNNN